MRSFHKRAFVPARPEPLPRFDMTRARVISGLDGLRSLKPAFLRTLSRELDVESLAARLCPVLLANHSAAILGLAEHVGGDQADELARRLQQRGYELADPSRYILTAPLLLAIARNQVTAAALEARHPAVRDSSPTALADAFQELVDWGVHNDASDLHINIRVQEAESDVYFTLSGRYVAPERFQRIPTATLMEMLAVAWMDIRGGNGAVFDPLIEQQGSLIKSVDGRPVLLRWASLATDQGPSVCLRLLRRDGATSLKSLSGLGYLPHQIQAIDHALHTSGGAILFAGRVGSGKSTTLASLMARIPSHRKVITLEDPVEYLIPGALQNTLVRNLGEPAHAAYASKLRTLKRSAMNDVLLGEIRDQETGRAFMDLAGSGVSVYSTTHAPSAALIPERLASDFIGVSRDFMATPGVLKLLVYQVLVPELCAQCALPLRELLHNHQLRRMWTGTRSFSEWLDAVSHAYSGAIEGLRIRNPQGCPACLLQHAPDLGGYCGRTVVAEHLVPSVQSHFLQSIRQADSLAYLLERPEPVFDAQAELNELTSAMHCAMHKSLAGQIDPRDIEAAFQPFVAPAHRSVAIRRALSRVSA